MNRFFNKHWPGLIIVATALALVISWQSAHAAGTTPKFSLVLPTANVDDSALPLANIDSIIIQWSRPGGTEIVGSKTIKGPFTSVNQTNLGGLTLLCGKYVFFAAVKATGTGGTSDAVQSNEYDTGVVCPKIPKPAGTFTVS